MRTELEISVSPIFSTPLLVFMPPAYEQINATLSQTILEREASVPPHADYEVVGWSSPHDLTMLDWAGEPLRALFTLCHRSRYTSHRLLGTLRPCILPT